VATEATPVKRHLDIEARSGQWQSSCYDAEPRIWRAASVQCLSKVIL